MTAPWTQLAQHQPPPGSATPKKSRTWAWALGVVAAFTVGIGAGAGSADHDAVPATQAAPATVTAPAETITLPAETIVETMTAAPETVVETVAPAPPVEATNAAGTIGEGVWRVGTDVEAGTYRTTGPDSSGLGMCYWARASDPSGEFNSLITNGILEGPGVVTIEDGEVFTSNGCNPWTLAS